MRLIWSLVAFLAFAMAVLLPVPAHSASYKADVETVGAGLVTFTLTDKPCSRGLILAELQPHWRSQFFDAEIYIHGTKQKIAACWSGNVSPGHAFVVDEAGQHGRIPLEAFLPPQKPQSF